MTLLSASPPAGGREAGQLRLAAASTAALACGPAVHHVALRSMPQFCPRPLGLTQITGRTPRLLHT